MAQAIRKYSTWEWARAYGALILTLPVFLICWFLATFVKRLPPSIVRRLQREHTGYTATHPRDFRIPPDPSIPAYMDRWWRIPRNPILNVYYHIIRRSDDDRALHCHPWWNFSIVLTTGYWEHRIREGGVHERQWCPPGTLKFRWHGKKAHRLELDRTEVLLSGFGRIEEEDTGKRYEELPVHTIFVTGPVLRRWGFHDGERGWVDAYDWDEHCERHGLTGMRMDGGSDAALSDRNRHKAN